jgi:hypothetical protein
MAKRCRCDCRCRCRETSLATDTDFIFYIEQAEAALAATRSQVPTDSSQDTSPSLGDWDMATDSSSEIENDSNLFMDFLTDASPGLGGLW